MHFRQCSKAVAVTSLESSAAFSGATFAPRRRMGDPSSTTVRGENLRRYFQDLRTGVFEAAERVRW